jgi:hypothetical protein
MCTVTYMPQGDGFAVVHSRDEMRSRGPMVAPLRDSGLNALYPVDVRGKGTWMLTSPAGYTVAMLNGGYERHQPQGPYRHSRGLVPLMFAKAGDTDAFLAGFDPQGVEPFTMVIVMHAQRTLTELIWTGDQFDRRSADDGHPHIWSSTTLYDRETRAQRADWFRAAVEKDRDRPAIDVLFDFHRTGGREVATRDRTIMMQRPRGPETVALVGVARDGRGWIMRYHDLVGPEQRTIRMIG